MKNKLIRNIIIAVVVISALAAAYFFALKWEPVQDTEDGTVGEAAEEIVVLQMKLDEIRSIEINNSKGTILIEKDGIDYKVPGYEKSNLASARLTSPFIKVEKIVAERKISGEVNPEDFGFGSPRATVSVIKTDGSKAQLIIGNADPTAFGYYVKTDEGEEVYLVEESRLEDFFCGIDDFKNKHIADFSFETLENLELYKGKELVSSIRLRNETDTLTDIVIEQHIMTYPYYEYISLEELSVPFKDITSITAINEVSDSASDGNAYGIGAYTFKYKDAYGSYVIKLGNRAPDGSVYAVCEGVNAVYTIPGEWLDIAESFSPFDYLYKLTHVYMIDDVSEVIFKCPSGEHKLEAANKSGAVEYSINGKAVSEAVYKNAYTVIMSMSFTGDGRKTAPGKEIGSITFRFNDGSSATSKYYEADERNYLVVRDDGAKYLVLKKNFDPVYESISKVIQ